MSRTNIESPDEVIAFIIRPLIKFKWFEDLQKSDWGFYVLVSNDYKSMHWGLMVDITAYLIMPFRDH